MKLKFLTLFAAVLMLGITEAGSSKAVAAANTNAVMYLLPPGESSAYNAGYSAGEHDRLNGNPYHTTWNPPTTPFAAKKDYQLGYLDGFSG